MRTYSDLSKISYESQDVVYIANPRQNAAYVINGGITKDCLVDIIGEDNNKLIFVWRKCEFLSYLFDKWCKHEL